LVSPENYIRHVFILWSPSWAVVQVRVVAGTSLAPPEQDKAVFPLPSSRSLRMMVSLQNGVVPLCMHRDFLLEDGMGSHIA
jgi:hypothetical protein